VILMSKVVAATKRSNDILTGEHLVDGNWALAEGAISAGCKFFGGYPITPSSEIAEHLSRRLPDVGGAFIQFEDEIASISALIGASWAGVKAMSATSGPGLSLMAEGIGLAAMTEAPCVIVDVMRGGPCTGQPTKPSQGDVMQLKWCSHGDYETIVLCPYSVQECYDLVIQAFNLAETYRIPVFVAADEIVAHMRETMVIPQPSQLMIVHRKKPTVAPDEYLPFKPDSDEDLVPPMATFGQGYRVHVTGLTHTQKGYPDSSKQEELVQRLCDKVRKHARDIVKVDLRHCDDAECVVVAYGVSARAALKAVEVARGNGIKAGLFRPITLWPSPFEFYDEIFARSKGVVVTEMNYGQIVREVERVAGRRKVSFLGKLGEYPPTPGEISAKIREVIK